MMGDEKLIKAASNAAQTIAAIYEWVDRVEANGGATSLSGIATCKAMLESLKGNKKRLNKSVIDPLNEAIADAMLAARDKS